MTKSTEQLKTQLLEEFDKKFTYGDTWMTYDQGGSPAQKEPAKVRSFLSSALSQMEKQVREEVSHDNEILVNTVLERSNHTVDYRKEISKILVKWEMPTTQAAINELLSLIPKTARESYQQGYEEGYTAGRTFFELERDIIAKDALQHSLPIPVKNESLKKEKDENL